MKKIVILLIPLIIIISIADLVMDKQFSFMNLLQSFSDIQRYGLTEFDWANIQRLLESYNFNGVWTSAGEAWENVYEIVTFWIAVGESFKCLWESIIRIGEILYKTIELMIYITTFFFGNIIAFVRFILYNILNLS